MSYKDTVLPIIRKTREISLPSWGTAGITNTKSLHPADVVTEIDTKIENFLRVELAKVHPDIVFVGEEGGGDRQASRFWLVDPIDATGHYVRGMRFTTTMLALIENGQVVFSAIYDFISDDMYWAEKGSGAFKNDMPIHVSDRSLTEGYVGIEIRMVEGKNMYMLQQTEKRTGVLHTISAGWEFAMIACGKLDGRIMIDPWGKDYDFAPGSLLVSEAGGAVRNFDSDSYDYRNRDFVAGNPKVVSELVEIFNAYAKE